MASAVAWSSGGRSGGGGQRGRPRAPAAPSSLTDGSPSGSAFVAHAADFLHAASVVETRGRKGERGGQPGAAAADPAGGGQYGGGSDRDSDEDEPESLAWSTTSGVSPRGGGEGGGGGSGGGFDGGRGGGGGERPDAPSRACGADWAPRGAGRQLRFMAAASMIEARLGDDGRSAAVKAGVGTPLRALPSWPPPDAPGLSALTSLVSQASTSSGATDEGEAVTAEVEVPAAASACAASTSPASSRSSSRSTSKRPSVLQLHFLDGPSSLELASSPVSAVGSPLSDAASASVGTAVATASAASAAAGGETTPADGAGGRGPSAPTGGADDTQAVSRVRERLDAVMRRAAGGTSLPLASAASKRVEVPVVAGVDATSHDFSSIRTRLEALTVRAARGVDGAMLAAAPAAAPSLARLSDDKDASTPRVGPRKKASMGKSTGGKASEGMSSGEKATAGKSRREKVSTDTSLSGKAAGKSAGKLAGKTSGKTSGKSSTGRSTAADSSLSEKASVAKAEATQSSKVAPTAGAESPPVLAIESLATSAGTAWSTDEPLAASAPPSPSATVSEPPSFEPVSSTATAPQPVSAAATAAAAACAHTPARLASAVDRIAAPTSSAPLPRTATPVAPAALAVTPSAEVAAAAPNDLARARTVPSRGRGRSSSDFRGRLDAFVRRSTSRGPGFRRSHTALDVGAAAAPAALAPAPTSPATTLPTARGRDPTTAAAAAAAAAAASVAAAATAAATAAAAAATDEAPPPPPPSPRGARFRTRIESMGAFHRVRSDRGAPRGARMDGPVVGGDADSAAFVTGMSLPAEAASRTVTTSGRPRGEGGRTVTGTGTAAGGGGGGGGSPGAPRMATVAVAQAASPPRGLSRWGRSAAEPATLPKMTVGTGWMTVEAAAAATAAAGSGAVVPDPTMAAAAPFRRPLFAGSSGSGSGDSGSGGSGGGGDRGGSAGGGGGSGRRPRVRSPALLTSGVDAVAALTALANKKGDTVLRGLVGGGGRRSGDVSAGVGATTDWLPPLGGREAPLPAAAFAPTSSSASTAAAVTTKAEAAMASTAAAAAAAPRRRDPSAVRGRAGGAPRPLRRMLSRRLSNASSASPA